MMKRWAPQIGAALFLVALIPWFLFFESVGEAGAEFFKALF